MPDTSSCTLQHLFLRTGGNNFIKHAIQSTVCRPVLIRKAYIERKKERKEGRKKVLKMVNKKIVV